MKKIRIVYNAGYDVYRIQWRRHWWNSWSTPWWAGRSWGSVGLAPNVYKTLDEAKEAVRVGLLKDAPWVDVNQIRAGAGTQSRTSTENRDTTRVSAQELLTLVEVYTEANGQFPITLDAARSVLAQATIKRKNRSHNRAL